jgi:hypothetical protein
MVAVPVFPALWKVEKGGKFDGSLDYKSETLCQNITKTAGCRWVTPIILASQEAEIRRITV